jgi:TatA/E family protein of Tat protein translocase
MPFPNIGPGELILILVIALIVLGPGRLPEVAQSLGKSVREFRKAATDVKEAASLEPTQGTAAQATAPSPPAATPNQLQGSSEPNRLDEPEASATPSGEQQSGSAPS